mmetsp:Transcript_23551/g.68142  ORF Transcript_23551/g.68142 Transcript_23551/m.68142 type:complete len:799 (-) Transcript_23551:372-2768(-)
MHDLSAEAALQALERAGRAVDSLQREHLLLSQEIARLRQAADCDSSPKSLGRQRKAANAHDSPMPVANKRKVSIVEEPDVLWSPASDAEGTRRIPRSVRQAVEDEPCALRSVAGDTAGVTRPPVWNVHHPVEDVPALLPCQVEDVAALSDLGDSEVVTPRPPQELSRQSSPQGSTGSRPRRNSVKSVAAVMRQRLVKQFSRPLSHSGGTRLSQRISQMIGTHPPDESNHMWDSARLHAVLKEKAPQEAFTVPDLERVIQELKQIDDKVNPYCDRPFQPAGMIAAEVIDSLKLIPDIGKQAKTPGLKASVTRVMAVLASKSVDEIIDDTTRYAIELKQGSPVEYANLSFGARIMRPDQFMTTLVSFTVVLNLVCTGISVDNDSDHVVWFLIEIACTLVFMLEFVYKVRRFGFADYFCGEAWRWNVFDFAVTVLSVLDVIFSGIMLTVTTADLRMSSASRLPLIFRAFRLIRIVRIIKLAHSPLLRDLSNMVIGCVVGLPSLLWVLLLLMLILYMTGMMFRLLVGNTDGTSYIADCGMIPDETLGIRNEELLVNGCILHYMYGEEFFGTVPASMFTAFRFMLGDFSSYEGGNIVVAMERGYGNKFRLPFVIWMVVLIFGVFNVITAVFVDSTSSGLKQMGLKRKYARKYERTYVKTKLKALLIRMGEILDASEGATHAEGQLGLDVGVGGRTMQLEQFLRFLSDEEFNSLLNDMDIDIWDPVGFFETCDTDCTGEVTTEEFIHGVLRLRGEPQKSDIVATFNAIRSVQRQLDDLLASNAWRPYRTATDHNKAAAPKAFAA